MLGHRALQPLLILLGVTTFPDDPRAEETRLSVSFTEISDLVAPVVMQTITNFRATATLSTSGSVSSGMERSSGKTRRENSENLKLGQSATSGSVSWHVSGPHELVGLTRYVNFSRAIRVTVSGNTCQASVGVSLDPGQTQYRYIRLTTRQEGVSRQIRAENVSCSIGQ